MLAQASFATSSSQFTGLRITTVGRTSAEVTKNWPTWLGRAVGFDIRRTKNVVPFRTV
jgi:hypothetical protein